MQFFLLDFALAFVALLGYRAVAAVAQDRVLRPMPGHAANASATR